MSLFLSNVFDVSIFWHIRPLFWKSLMLSTPPAMASLALSESLLLSLAPCEDVFASLRRAKTCNSPTRWPTSMKRALLVRYCWPVMHERQRDRQLTRSNNSYSIKTSTSTENHQCVTSKTCTMPVVATGQANHKSIINAPGWTARKHHERTTTSSDERVTTERPVDRETKIAFANDASRPIERSSNEVRV